jgi:thiamine transport system permease protein
MVRHLLWLLPLLFLAVFFFTPLAKVLAIMASRQGVVSLPGILKPLWFTLWQAALSTLLTLIIGLPVAYVFARYKFTGKRVLRLLVTLPFILPTVVVAAGYNALMGPRGWLNLVLMNVFQLDSPPIVLLNSVGAILLAHVFYNTSVVVRVVGSAWSQLDAKLSQAGSVLGASPIKVLFNVTLPLLKPSILAAMLMVFLFDFTSFGVILLLGGPGFSTLETEIYTQTLSMLNLRMAGILSIIQLVCTLLVTVFYTRVNSRRALWLKPGLGSEPKSGMYLREKIWIAATGIFLGLYFLAPLASLVIRSFIAYDPISGMGQFTLRNYTQLFINQRQSYFYVPPIQAAINSLVFGGITVLISLILGTSMSYAQTNLPRLRKWIDNLVMLPLGASAVTLGLGFLLTFNRSPFDVANFPVLIPIAHSLIAFPFVLRAVQPVLSSIPRQLKDAAATLGASPWKVWWQVEVPIVSRAMLVGGIYAFAISLGEFGATSFLARVDLPTLPVAIYRFLSQPGDLNYGQALAMATLLMLVCAAAISVIERIPIPGLTDY